MTHRLPHRVQCVVTSVVTVGLADVAAGSVAMGPGGCLAAPSEAEPCASEVRRERL
jgi:hypothetical protein